MNIPNLMPFQLEPFNGDTFIQEEFLNLKKKYNLSVAVETGTCLGSTSIFLSKHFDKVFTVEVNPSYREIALQRFSEEGIPADKITSLEGSSIRWIGAIVNVGKVGHNSIFFLDAHWGSECPLESELNIIAELGLQPVIAIHDFQVPDQPQLGYDSTPLGQPFTYSWLKPVFDKIYGANNYYVYYNSDEKSTSVKRGIIYICPNLMTEHERKETLPTKETQPVSSDKYSVGGLAIEEKHPEISLYVNFYRDENASRDIELQTTLAGNIDCKEVDRIIAVVDDENEFEYLKKLSPKIQIVQIDHRPTYNEFFKLINEKIESPNEISILANADIYITPTVAVLTKKHLKKPLCFALSAWDKMPDGTYEQMKKNVNEKHKVPKSDSQDAWIFKGKIINIPDCNFMMGMPGCDNAIAERLQRAGYKVVNPSNDIRPVHYHQSAIRNYDTTDTSVKNYVNPDRIEKPYLILPPVSLNLIPFVNDSAWPEFAGDHVNDPVVSASSNWIDEIHSLKDIKGGESQFSEDAIIEHIFQHIGSPNRFFVDLGAGAYDGSTMSNTRTLKRKGWIGYGVDINPTKDHHVIKSFIRPDNVVELMTAQRTPNYFDFLNLDIDSSDFWVLKKILESGYKPRVICTEFNGTLDPNVSVVLRYEKGYSWDRTNKYGYSFAAGKKLLERYGYAIIYNLHDTDIFAVRKELVQGLQVNVTAKQQFYHPINPSAIWDTY